MMWCDRQAGACRSFYVGWRPADGGAGLSFMVGPVALHGCLGTGAIFSKVFPVDFRAGVSVWAQEQVLPELFPIDLWVLGTGTLK